jgi:ATP-binding cassette subfamily B protein
MSASALKGNDAQHSEASLAQARPLLAYLNPYRLHVAVATVAIFFTSSAVLGIGAALKYLIDEGFSKGDAALLDRAYEILIGVTLLLATASFVRFFLVSWVGERVVADIRRDIHARLLSMHIGFFETTRTGELLSRLTTDTTLIQSVIGSSVSVAARHVLTMSGAFVLLLITSWQLTGYMLLMLPLVVAPIIIMGRRVRRYGRESQDRVADISAEAEETFSAIRAVQALSLERYSSTRFDNMIDRALATASQRIRTRALLTGLVIFLVFGAVVTVLWFGGRDVLAGRISAGDLSAFVFYSVVVAGAVGALSEVVTDFQRALGASARIAELLAMQPQVASPASPMVLAEGQVSATVQFTGVSFTYPARPEKPALSEFTLSVPPGSTVALVGPSGAGKTTLFQLLLRFYDPDSGQITIDGVDIKNLALAQLRGLIGLVPQDPVIFSGTARDNIALGNAQASEADIIEAARAAAALEFIEKMPQGLDTHLGEKGIQLSGGQRQRIAIARAVVRNPRILLLDEATSALDAENEHLIQQALARVMAGRTTFVIAHRLATVVRAERIVLLNEGRIEAVGTHQQLLEQSPLYARLSALQFKTAA